MIYHPNFFYITKSKYYYGCVAVNKDESINRCFIRWITSYRYADFLFSCIHFTCLTLFRWSLFLFHYFWFEENYFKFFGRIWILVFNLFLGFMKNFIAKRANHFFGTAHISFECDMNLTKNETPLNRISLMVSEKLVGFLQP